MKKKKATEAKLDRFKKELINEITLMIDKRYYKVLSELNDTKHSYFTQNHQLHDQLYNQISAIKRYLKINVNQFGEITVDNSQQCQMPAMPI